VIFSIIHSLRGSIIHTLEIGNWTKKKGDALRDHFPSVRSHLFTWVVNMQSAHIFTHTHCSSNSSSSVCTCRRRGRRKKIRAVIFRGVVSPCESICRETHLLPAAVVLCFTIISASECMRARRPPAAGLRPAGRKKCTAVHGPLRAHQSAMWENPSFLLIPTFSAAALWPSTKFCTCISVCAHFTSGQRTYADWTRALNLCEFAKKIIAHVQLVGCRC
jgi:hypothetical protein